MTTTQTPAAAALAGVNVIRGFAAADPHNRVLNQRLRTALRWEGRLHDGLATGDDARVARALGRITGLAERTTAEQTAPKPEPVTHPVRVTAALVNLAVATLDADVYGFARPGYTDAAAHLAAGPIDARRADLAADALVTYASTVPDEGMAYPDLVEYLGDVILRLADALPAEEARA